jgi:peptidoglycan/xylan/chitin deacetylase (PgdA/CDA1 family)
MRGKRQLAAKICSCTGVTRILENLPRRAVLMILNYHRVGNRGETPYDPGTFSCTAEEFERQIEYLKGHFQIATLQQTLSIAIGGAKLSDPTVLITFDDGYIDNFRVAFPILRKHRVPAAFFLPTAFVGTDRLPWWDVIAHIVKRSKNRTIPLHYPDVRTFDLDRDGVDGSIMQILRFYKQPAVKDPEQFVSGLELACRSARPSRSTERCFLNWDEAREMQATGMSFGSHTHTHEILSKMPIERQLDEVRQSKAILESELRKPTDTIAYPVGGLNSFSEETVRACRESGYRAAFSFYGGLNMPTTIQPFDVRRFDIGGHSQARVRLRTALASITGRYYK